MTMMKRFFLTIALAALALPALAYNDRITHRDLSVIATQKSQMYLDPDIMFALGYRPPQMQFFTYYGSNGRVRTGIRLLTLADVLGEGAVREDIGDAPKNHFYDPVRERPITVFGFNGGRMSWQWMLEPEQYDGQNNSLRDALDQLTLRLTYSDGSAQEAYDQRSLAGGNLLLTLGHAMHHMQDMAQPQHVRNDAHLEDIPGFEFLTPINPLHNPSRYERFTSSNERRNRIKSLAQAGSPVFPGSPAFKIKRDFWTNAAHTGIAETVNHDFVSQGTNFAMRGSTPVTTDYASPTAGAPVNYTPAQLFAFTNEPITAGIRTLCGNAGVDCTMTMYGTAVGPRMSTYSIFDQDLEPKGREVRYALPGVGPVLVGRIFDLNRFNFDAAHPELMKRAVSYSAGIVNHFFRGKLFLGLPDKGPYAVADQTTGTGFTKVKLAVGNDTPNEELSGGTIRLIAKFYRNGCYKTDLSGEWQISNGQFVVPCNNWRNTEEIRVSEPQQVSLGVGEDKQMAFTFAKPIPFDATDLILQGYYTGAVGEEADSFALGAVDVSEPTFLGIMNATDVFDLLGTFYFPDYIISHFTELPFSNLDTDDNDIYNAPPDIRVEGEDARLEITIDLEKVADVAAVPQGRFTRLAVIGDPNTPLLVEFRAIGAHFDRSFAEGLFPKLFQEYPAENVYRITPVRKFRDVLQNGLIEFHAFAPSSMADFNTMPPSRDPNAAIAIPAVMSTGTQSSRRAATQSVMESSRPIEANVVTPAAISTETLPGAPNVPPVGQVPIDK
ncbi:MAG: hypothetical protein QOJ98_2686 [Acidobacteriota bacterium]|nr:hypothetical protein [Acidobacteriota bacterium]